MISFYNIGLPGEYKSTNTFTFDAWYNEFLSKFKT